MSQSARPPQARSQYQRSVAGMIGAMVVTVAVGGGWYLLGRPDEETRPVKSQPWAVWANSGRSDGKLAVLAPDTLPKGWRATSAKYDSGVAPLWHLGMLTDSEKFVGLDESYDTVEDIVSENVDENATRGEDVTIGGETWQTYTDSGGDYAVVRTLTTPQGERERVLVYGSASDAQIRDFAASLSATSTPTD